MSATQFTDVREQVADKVRKLLTQSEDSGCTNEEAQAFAEKAQQLISRYSIDAALIAAVDPARRESIGARDIEVPGPNARRKCSLLFSIGRANDCRGVWISRYKWDPRSYRHVLAYYVNLVGYESDLDWTQTLWASLEIQLVNALRVARKDKPSYENGRTFAVNFIDGFTSAVSSRLQRAKREAAAAAQEAVNTERRELIGAALDYEVPASVSLVLVEKQARVEEEYKVKHPRTRTTYVRSAYSPAGRNAGTKAGNNASLARGSLSGNRSLGR